MITIRCFLMYSPIFPFSSFLSQSAIMRFGVSPMSVWNCINWSVMVWPSRSVRGYVYFWWVARSARKRQYLTPPIAVDDPYPISMCTVSPNDSSLSGSFLFAQCLRMVACCPVDCRTSSFVFRSLTVFIVMSGRCWRSLSIFLKPKY